MDWSILTHSGETVGQVIQKISNPKYPADIKGLVQQYLEPYSLLCHDVLLSTIGPDTPPLVNILAHYPIGSEQPAWVDLFREGHFQLYYNAHLIRIFIKGSNPKYSFEKHHSVIRHSIQDVINSAHTSINNLEVYVFNNNYANAKLDLDTIPHVYKIADLDLSPKRKSIDLTSIEDLLRQSVVLEAAEVDANNDLYFYGRCAILQFEQTNALNNCRSGRQTRFSLCTMQSGDVRDLLWNHRIASELPRQSGGRLESLRNKETSDSYGLQYFHECQHL